jgi:hypothetical protein
MVKLAITIAVLVLGSAGIFAASAAASTSGILYIFQSPDLPSLLCFKMVARARAPVLIATRRNFTANDSFGAQIFRVQPGVV